MNVYMIEISSSYEYAQIHSQLGQNIGKGNKIKIMWNDSKWQNNKIPDFFFSMYMICMENIATDLLTNFKGLSQREVVWEKNPKELSSKNLKKLKWLPQEDVDVSIIFTDIEVPILSQSTVIYGLDRNGNNCIKSIEGIAELRGENMISREANKGIYFSKEDIGHFDFFRPILSPTNWIFCTETIKKYIENRKFSNVFFLDAGNIV